MDRAPTAEAEGKRVVDPDGAEIGIVKSVDNGLAYITPDPSLPEAVLAKLGWGGASRHEHPLDSQKIDAITTTEVHLREAPDFDQG